MRPLLILILCGSLIACSGSKKTASTEQKSKNTSTKITSLKNAPEGKVDTSEKTVQKVTEVIEKHTKYSINDIARSNIIRTKNGYWWRFLNTRTGERFTVTTNASFTTVNIQKKSRKRS